jgi:hypothetical protein
VLQSDVLAGCLEKSRVMPIFGLTKSLTDKRARRLQASHRGGIGSGGTGWEGDGRGTDDTCAVGS